MIKYVKAMTHFQRHEDTKNTLSMRPRGAGEVGLTHLKNML
ncbi:hypothetical protein ACFDR9_003052 [Janthinobacterium sp. CG_23.3]